MESEAAGLLRQRSVPLAGKTLVLVQELDLCAYSHAVLVVPAVAVVALHVLEVRVEGSPADAEALPLLKRRLQLPSHKFGPCAVSRLFLRPLVSLQGLHFEPNVEQVDSYHFLDVRLDQLKLAQHAVNLASERQVAPPRHEYHQRERHTAFQKEDAFDPYQGAQGRVKLGVVSDGEVVATDLDGGEGGAEGGEKGLPEEVLEGSTFGVGEEKVFEGHEYQGVMFQQQQEGLKTRFFKFLQQNSKHHIAVFSYILIILENLLILYYSLSPAFNLDHMLGYSALRDVLSRMHILSLPTYQARLAALYALTVIHLLHYLLFLFENSLLLAAYYRIGSVFLIEACVNVLFCQGTQDCYSGSYSVHVIVGGAVLVAGLCEFLVFSLKWDSNPFHTLPNPLFTSEGGLDWLAKLVLKVAFPILFVYMTDPNGTTLGLLILHLGYLLMFKLDSNAFNSFAFELELFLDACNIWFTICLALQHFNQGALPDLTLFPTIVAAPFFASLVVIYHRWQISRLLKQPLQSLQNEQKLVTALYRLTVMSQQEVKQRFLNYVIMHSVACERPECLCRQYLVKGKQKGAMSELGLVRGKGKGKDGRKQKEGKEQLELVLQLMEGLDEQMLKAWPVKFLQSCLYMEQNNCAFRALHNILFFKESKMDILKEYGLFTIALKVRKHVELMEYRQRKEKLGSFESMAYFNESVLALQTQLQQLAELFINFYKELLEQKPIIAKLLDFALLIEGRKRSVSSTFRSLLSYNKNHLRLKRLHSIFFESYQDEEGSSMGPLGDGSIQSLRGEESREVLVISIVLFGSECGTIVDCNDELKAVLGYKGQQLCGQKLARIMPRVYRDIHDKLIQRFLYRTNNNVNYKRVKVSMLKSNNYCLMGDLFMRIMPVTNHALRLYAFTRATEESALPAYYLILDMAQGCVAGLSQSFQTLLRIPELRQEQLADLALDKLFPSLHFKFQTSSDVNALEKVTTMLDLGYMLEELQEFYSDAEDLQPIQVVLDIDTDFRYENSRIVVLKLVEVNAPRSRYRQPMDEPIQSSAPSKNAVRNEGPKDGESSKKDFEEEQQTYLWIKSGLMALSFLLYVVIVAVSTSVLSSNYTHLLQLLDHMTLNSERFEFASRLEFLAEWSALIAPSPPVLNMTQLSSKLTWFEAVQSYTDMNASLIPALASLANITVPATKLSLDATVKQLQGSIYLFFQFLWAGQSSTLQLKQMRSLYEGLVGSQQALWQRNNDLLLGQMDSIWNNKVAILITKVVWALVTMSLELVLARQLWQGWNKVVEKLNHCTREEVLGLIKRSSALHLWLRSSEDHKQQIEPQRNILLEEDEEELGSKGIYVQPLEFAWLCLAIVALGALKLAVVGGVMGVDSSSLSSISPALQVFNSLNYESMLLSRAQNVHLQVVLGSQPASSLSSLFNEIVAADQTARTYYHESFLYDQTNNSPNLISKMISSAEAVLILDHEQPIPALLQINEQYVGAAFIFANETCAYLGEHIRSELTARLTNTEAVKEAVSACLILVIFLCHMALLREISLKADSFRYLSKLELKSYSMLKLSDGK